MLRMMPLLTGLALAASLPVCTSCRKHGVWRAITAYIGARIRGRVPLHLGDVFTAKSGYDLGPASGRATRLSRGTSGATSLAT